MEKALVADVAPQDLKGTMMGMYSMVTGVGLLPASLITGFVWERFGAAASFYMNGALAIAAALLLSFFLRKQVEQ